MVNAMVEVVWQWQTTSSGVNTIIKEQTKMLFMQKCNVMYMKYKCVKDITHYIHRFKNLC